MGWFKSIISEKTTDPTPSSVEGLNSQVAELKDEIGLKTIDLSLLKQQMESERSALLQVKAERDMMEAELASERCALSRVKAEHEKTEAEIASERETLSKIKAEHEKVKAEMASERETLSKIKAEREKVKAEMAFDERDELSKIKAEYEKVKVEMASERSRLSKIKMESRRLMVKLLSDKYALARINTEYEKLETELKSGRCKLSELEAARKKAETELEKNKKEFDDYIAEYKKKDPLKRTYGIPEYYKREIDVGLYKLKKISHTIYESIVVPYRHTLRHTSSIKDVEGILSEKLFERIRREFSSVNSNLEWFIYSLGERSDSLQQKMNALENMRQEYAVELYWLKSKRKVADNTRSKIEWNEERIRRRKKRLRHKQNILYLATRKYERDMLELLEDKNDLLFIFKSLKKTSPIFELIIQEMSKQLTDETHKEIFSLITQGDSLRNIAATKGVSYKKVCRHYEAAIKILTKQYKVS